jgi:hypothetical protein
MAKKRASALKYLDALAKVMSQPGLCVLCDERVPPTGGKVCCDCLGAESNAHYEAAECECYGAPMNDSARDI